MDSEGRPRNDRTEPPPRSWWRRGLICVSWLAASLTIGGLLVRLTVRDSVPGLSTLFYATPLPLLVLGAVYGVGHHAIFRRWRSVCFWGLLLSILLPWTIRESWRPAAPAVSREGEVLSLLFWNVARKKDLGPAADLIRRIDADVVGLVEVVGAGEDWRAFFNEQLPQYDVSVLGGGTYLLVRGSSGESTGEALGRHSIYRKVPVRVRGRDYLCFVVDVESDVIRSRGPALTRLAEVVDRYRDENVVILGDFNTPADSLHLPPLRERHRLLFEEVGSGYAPTWPLPVPVLHLDQIWINENLEPLSCEHGFSWASDHRPVLGRVRPARD